jgi:hypothetical protein
MYVERNTEACSNSHCCLVEAISIIHSECVFVALGIAHQRPCAFYVIFVACLSLRYFPHCLVYDTTFVKASLDIKYVF